MRVMLLPLLLLLIGCPAAADDDDAVSDDDDVSVDDDDAAPDDDDATDDDDAIDDDDDDDGPPDLEALDAALRDNEQLTACFDAAEDAGTNLGDRIVLNLVIEPDGSVSAAGIITPEHQDTELDTCVSTVVLALSFEPWTGEATTINYTFFF